MIHSERILTETYTNEHLLLCAPFITMPDGRRTIALNWVDPTQRPLDEIGKWVSCPDWQLMLASPGGDYWHCRHGVLFPPDKGGPKIIPWAAVPGYGLHPDYRNQDEVDNQAFMAEVLAISAFGAAYAPDAPRLGQERLAPDEIHKAMRLSVGLYLDANRWQAQRQTYYGRNHYAHFASVAAGIAAASAGYQGKQWL